MYADPEEGQSSTVWVQSRSVLNARKCEEPEVHVVCLASILLVMALHGSIENFLALLGVTRESSQPKSWSVSKDGSTNTYFLIDKLQFWSVFRFIEKSDRVLAYT